MDQNEKKSEKSKNGKEKNLEKVNNSESEINSFCNFLLHKLSFDDIEAVVGEKAAVNIENARSGKMTVHSGGGGNYGKVEVKK